MYLTLVSIFFSRCRAYNTAELVIFMTEIFDNYMRQRLVDVAMSRRRIKPVSVAKISVPAVKSFGNGKYTCQSESEPMQVYEVDLTIGISSCTKGENGAICKQQIACADYSMIVVPQMYQLTRERRQLLAVLAVGQEKTPKDSFFKRLNETEDLKGNNEVNLCNENIEMETVWLGCPFMEIRIP